MLLPRRLVVLDEPTNGLDPAGTRDVRGIISELHAGGATVVVSSHLLTEVEATCTHVAVLQSGSLIAEGELRGLRRRTDTSRVEVALSASGEAVDPGAGGSAITSRSRP